MQSTPTDRIQATGQETLHRPWQVFQRARIQYAIALEDGTELLEHAGAAAIPFPPQGVIGLVNWHGNPIPLTDIAQLSGTQRQLDAARALVLGRGEHAVALALDTLPNVVRLAPEQIHDVNEAPQSIRALLDGVLILPDKSKAYWLNASRIAQRLTAAS